MSTSRLVLVASIIAASLGGVKLQAVELLVSPGFEPPTNAPPIAGWDLSEFVTGSPLILDTAELAAGSTETPPGQLFLKSFSGNGTLDPNDGNFDNDLLPRGDVDGMDFLAWQRGLSPHGGDPNGRARDLATWEANYGREGGLKTNVSLSQTVDVTGAVGQTYTFSGYALWEDNYSGGVDTLDPTSPLGPVASPTSNHLTLEFIGTGGAVLGTHTINLKEEGQVNANVYQQQSVSGIAPVGTTRVRVTADARDMVYNTDPSQAAYYDSFSLTASGAPAAQLLDNEGLDDPPFTALDFWDIFQIPAGCCNNDILRSVAGETFAAHTGTRGVFLKPFFGAHPMFQSVPVTGLMSQTVDVVPGGSYAFSGWAKFEQNYSGGVNTISAASPGFFAGDPSPTATIIAVEWLDIDGDVINPIIDFDPNGVTILDPNSPNLIDLRAERQALCGGNANDETCVFPGQAKTGWTQHSLTDIIAPANAVSARLTAGMTNGVFNIDPRQAAFFDDFSFNGPAPPLQAAVGTVPEPASVVGLAIGGLALGLMRRRRRSV